MFHLTLFESGGLLALAQVLMIDVVLAGDNAVVIGMAAARVPAAIRKKVILWGLAAAVVLRVGLAAVAVVADADHRPDPGGGHTSSMGELALLARHSRRTQGPRPGERRPPPSSAPCCRS